MLALSVRQPWAWAIIFAGKPIENRSWWTWQRGRILIHAGRTMTRADYAGACEAFPDVAWPHRDSLQFGGVIGSVDLVHCTTHSDSRWFFGPYGFVLRDPKPLDFHVCKGALGFFEVPYG